MMGTEELVISAAAIIVFCVLLVAQSVLAYMGKIKAVQAFKKYKPYAVMAAKWVEETIPDEFGANEEDSKTARAAHKVDMFTKKFLENVEKYTGDKTTKALQAEAMEWSVELAERLSKPKEEKSDA